MGSCLNVLVDKYLHQCFREIFASMAHPMWRGSIFGSSEVDFIWKGWSIVEELRIIHLHHWPPLQGGLCASLSTAFNRFPKAWLVQGWLEIPSFRWWDSEYVFLHFHFEKPNLNTFSSQEKRNKFTSWGMLLNFKASGQKMWLLFWRYSNKYEPLRNLLCQYFSDPHKPSVELYYGGELWWKGVVRMIEITSTF